MSRIVTYSETKRTRRCERNSEESLVQAIFLDLFMEGVSSNNRSPAIELLFLYRLRDRQEFSVFTRD